MFDEGAHFRPQGVGLGGSSSAAASAMASASAFGSVSGFAGGSSGLGQGVSGASASSGAPLPLPSDLSELQATIDYYAQQGFYQSIERVAGDVISRAARSSNPATGQGSQLELHARYWRGFALASSGNRQDAIRMLQPLRSNPELALAVVSLLLQTTKGASAREVGGAEVMANLKDELKALTRASGDEAFLLAARYFWHSDKLKQAKTCVDKVLDRSPDSVAASTVSGWIYLASGNARFEARAVQLFTQAVAKAAAQAAADPSNAAAATAAATAVGATPGLVSGSSSRDLSAMFGRAMAHVTAGQWAKAMEDFNSVVVLWPHFAPGLVEKAKLQALQGAWDESTNTVQRVLVRDPLNLCAVQLPCLSSLAREGSVDSTIRHARALLAAIDEHEPSNHSLYNSVGRALAQWGARKPALVSMAETFISRALAMQPSSSAYLTEQAGLRLQVGDVATASGLYQSAARLDENNVDALYGRIRCRVVFGELAEAQQELDFLKEIQASETLAAAGAEKKDDVAGGGAGGDGEGGNGGASASAGAPSHADLWYLLALTRWRKLRDEGPQTVSLLVECTRAVVTAARTMDKKTGSLSFFASVNARLVQDCAELAVVLAGSLPLRQDEERPAALQQLAKLVETFTTEFFPGNSALLVALARLRTVLREPEAADRHLVAATRLADSSALVFLAQAQLAVGRNAFSQAAQDLDQARSLDFNVRNSLSYHVLRAKILDASFKAEDAAKTLLFALSLPGVGKPSAGIGVQASTTASTGSAAAGGAGASSGLGVTGSHFADLNAAAGSAAAQQAGGGPPGALGIGIGSSLPAGACGAADRIALAVDLGALLLRLDRPKEAVKVMGDVATEYRTTPEAHRVLLAEAELLLRQRDADAALRLLQQVPASSSSHVRARLSMAEIYLNHQKNRRAHIQCYQQLASELSTSQAYVMLGDAFIRVQEPQKAIDAYEAALQRDATDPALTSRIGEALVATHDYARAVTFYAAAFQANPAQASLCHALAELYLQLKSLDSASRLLTEALASPLTGGGELAKQVADVGCLKQLARVHSEGGAPDQAEQALLQAKAIQTRVVEAARSADQRRQGAEEMANLCYLLGQHWVAQRATDKARPFFEEALEHSKTHEKARLELSRLLLLEGDLDGCLSQCQTQIMLDPNNAEATLRLADLKFRTNDPEGAISLFQQILKRTPGNFAALSRLIVLLRRAGKLAEAGRFIKLCEKEAGGAATPAGLWYCRGLLAWYQSDPREAVSCLNNARRDAEWGCRAMLRMIEVYLNPDHAGMLQTLIESKEPAPAETIASVERLLKELTMAGERGPGYTVLEAYADMATRQPQRVEKALSSLMATIREDRDYVPGNVALAVALMLLNQQTKARNQLKRVAKMKVNPEYQADFELCWLMLAQSSVETGKEDEAEKACQQCLAGNKSCSKALELLGGLKEKADDFKSAVAVYEQAWALVRESSPSLGFRLASSYLRVKRHLDAIGICHKILALKPDFPKVRKEILDKARAALRP